MSERRAFAGALGIYTAGGLFWAFLPFFVGLQISIGGMTEAEAGSLGSAYLIGFSVASLTGLWWVPRFDWRALVVVGAVVIVLSLFLLQGTQSYGPSLVSVFVIGLMMGSFWTVAYRIFSASSNPDRSFAIGIVVSYTALALVSYGIGRFVAPHYGLTGSAYVLGALIITLGFSALLVPSGPASPADGTLSVSYRPPLRVGLALLGILGTGFAFAAVWAFAERIGVAAGFDPGRISPVVASNLLASAAGSVLATVLGTSWGRKRTLLAGMVLMAAAIVSLLWADAFWVYGMAVAGLGFTIGFVLPYQMGALAALDAEGRFVVLIAAAQGIGSAAGPFLGGVAVEAGGIRPLLLIASLVLALSAVAFASITTNEDV